MFIHTVRLNAFSRDIQAIFVYNLKNNLRAIVVFHWFHTNDNDWASHRSHSFSWQHEIPYISYPWFQQKFPSGVSGFVIIKRKICQLYRDAMWLLPMTLIISRSVHRRHWANHPIHCSIGHRVCLLSWPSMSICKTTSLAQLQYVRIIS